MSRHDPFSKPSDKIVPIEPAAAPPAPVTKKGARKRVKNSVTAAAPIPKSAIRNPQSAILPARFVFENPEPPLDPAQSKILADFLKGGRSAKLPNVPQSAIANPQPPIPTPIPITHKPAATIHPLATLRNRFAGLA